MCLYVAGHQHVAGEQRRPRHPPFRGYGRSDCIPDHGCFRDAPAPCLRGDGLAELVGQVQRRLVHTPMVPPMVPYTDAGAYEWPNGSASMVAAPSITSASAATGGPTTGRPMTGRPTTGALTTGAPTASTGIRGRASASGKT